MMYAVPASVAAMGIAEVDTHAMLGPLQGKCEIFGHDMQILRLMLDPGACLAPFRALTSESLRSAFEPLLFR
jgi:hypothetical protein